MAEHLTTLRLDCTCSDYLLRGHSSNTIPHSQLESGLTLTRLMAQVGGSGTSIDAVTEGDASERGAGLQAEG